MEYMKKKGVKRPSIDMKPKKAKDYDSYGFKNSVVDKADELYLGEENMYTGNPWVDIGIAAGREYAQKAGTRARKRGERAAKRGDRQAKRANKKKGN